MIAASTIPENSRIAGPHVIGMPISGKVSYCLKEVQLSNTSVVYFWSVLLNIFFFILFLLKSTGASNLADYAAAHK